MVNDTKELTNLKQKQNAAKAQVERFHKRNELIAKIDTLKLRIPIAKYEAARQEHLKLKEERSAARKKAQELQQRNLPLKDRTDGYEARMKEAKRKVEKSQKEIDTSVKEIKKCEEKIKTLDNVANDLRVEVTSIRKNKNARERKLDSMRKEIPKLENAAEKAQAAVDELPDGTELTVPQFLDNTDLESTGSNQGRQSRLAEKTSYCNCGEEYIAKGV